MFNFKVAFLKEIQGRICEEIRTWGGFYEVFKKPMHKMEGKDKDMLFLLVFSLITKEKNPKEGFLSEEIIEKHISNIKGCFYKGKLDIPLFYNEKSGFSKGFKVKKGRIINGAFLTRGVSYYKGYFPYKFIKKRRFL